VALTGATGLAAASTGCGASGPSDPVIEAPPGFGDAGSSGTSGLGSSGNVGDADPNQTCAASTVTAKRAPANVLFVVDRSGSMNCNPPPITTSQACELTPTTADPSKPTKWSITRDALKAAIAGMPPTNSAGLTYFNVDDDCAAQATPNVPVKLVDAAHLMLLSQSLDNVTPGGNTPIVGGVTLGYQYLHTNTFVGREFLVLIADGAETCAPDQKAGFLATTVPNAAAVGIKTFVIGAPGSEPSRSFLSQIAFAGQTSRTPTCTHSATPPDVGDCHFDLTSSTLNLATELNKALEAISKEALSCEYDVPQAEAGVVDPGRVNVVYKPAGAAEQTIPQDNTTGCATADGWQYSADRQRIVLCGAACTKVKTDETGSISIQLGCATVVR
jgi:hypothetical protein